MIKILKKIILKLEEKFGDQFFSCSYLFNKNDVELHKEIFDKFHYIFSLKEEGKTYLWNRFVSKNYYEKEFEKEEFTKEELTFINDIKNVINNDIIKYGVIHNGANINKEIKTSRLIIKAFNDEINEQYHDYFKHNKEEYDNFYNDEYKNSNYIENMTIFPLGFALLLKETNELIGHIGFTNINECLYNLEYFIKKEY